MKGGASRTARALEERITARQAAKDGLSLEVAILGDGKGTDGYKKRQQLRRRLANHPFVSHVTIPEMLHVDYPKANVKDLEQIAIGEADVVLCLEAPSRPPLGAHTEAFGFFDDSEPDKWYRCRPAEREDELGDVPLVTTLADDAFKVIETYDYDPAEWEACGRITSACERRIEIMGYRKLNRRTRNSERLRRWLRWLVQVG